MITLPRIAERLASRTPQRLPFTPTHVPAAVMVLLSEGITGPEVLLTQRSDAVEKHKAEVSLPGGAKDPIDHDEYATAAREAEEEVGLPRGAFRVIGRLDDYKTITGFHVSPVVAVAENFDGLHPTSAEVAEVFAFPLSHLLTPENVQRVPMNRAGHIEDVLFVPWRGRLVWGITARILVNLVEATQ